MDTYDKNTLVAILLVVFAGLLVGLNLGFIAILAGFIWGYRRQKKKALEKQMEAATEKENEEEEEDEE